MEKVKPHLERDSKIFNTNHYRFYQNHCQVGINLVNDLIQSLQFCTIPTQQTVMETKTDSSKNFVYRDQLITKDDLTKFKSELIEDLKKVMTNQPIETKKWLKSYEVRRMLKISPGTLQNMRINRTLPFTKIGGVMYYAYDDIMKMLEDHKTKNPSQLSFVK